MQLTLFLSQIFGITFILGAFSMLLEKKMMMEMLKELVEDRALLYVLGVFDFVLGLAIVLTHNVWEGRTLTTVITALGWLMLLKGVVRILTPTATIKRWYKQWNIATMLPLMGLISLALGVYLTYNGFSGIYY